METYTLTSPAAPTLKKEKGTLYPAQKKIPRACCHGVCACLCVCLSLFYPVHLPYRWDQVRPQLIATYLSSFLDFTAVTQKTAIEVFTSLINTIALAFVTTIIGACIDSCWDLWQPGIFHTHGFAVWYAVLQG